MKSRRGNFPEIIADPVLAASVLVERRLEDAQSRTGLHVKSLNAAAQEMRSPCTEAIVTRYVRALFKRLPRLSAFRLGDDFAVGDLTESNPTLGPTAWSLYPTVMQSIVELVECHPEALPHIRHRTFARSSY